MDDVTERDGNYECGECGAQGNASDVTHEAGCKNATLAKVGEEVYHRTFDMGHLDNDVEFQKSIDVENRKATHIISSSTLDRYNDIVDAEFWDTKNFMRNPVVLADHRASIVNIIGKSLSVTHKGTILSAETKFGDDGMGETAFSLVKADLARTWSVGFRGTESHRITEGAKGGKKGLNCSKCKTALKKILNGRDIEDVWVWGRHFTGQELLEYSLVTIPANPDAVMSMVSKGLIDAKHVEQFFSPDISKETEDHSHVIMKALEEMRDANKVLILDLGSTLVEAIRGLTEEVGKTVAPAPEPTPAPKIEKPSAEIKADAAKPNAQPIKVPGIDKDAKAHDQVANLTAIHELGAQMKRLTREQVLKTAVGKRDLQ